MSIMREAILRQSVGSLHCKLCTAKSDIEHISARPSSYDRE